MVATHASALSAPASLAGLAFEAIPAPMAILAPDQTILEANAALADLLQAPTASLLGEPLAGRLRSVASETLIDDGAQTFGFRGPDGCRWLRLDLSQVGKQALAMLIDVTGERVALERMSAYLAQRNQLMSDADISVWRYDPDAELYEFSSETTRGNARAHQSFSLEVARTFRHPDDLPAAEAIIQRLTREVGAEETEMRLRTRDGGWQRMHVRYRSGRQLKSGLYEVHGVSQDVTALIEARDEAKKAASRLKLALDAARAGVFGYDFAPGQFWWSQEFRDLVGAQNLDAANRAQDPTVMFHPDDRELLLTLRAQCIVVDQAASVEARLLRGDEQPLWVRVYWVVEFDSAGEPAQAIGLLIDTDDQKRQELAVAEARRVAESATASKSSFLASVSHEIRTPMNGIVGVLNLLKREPLSTEGRDLLGEALACSDMLSQLVDDVLDFSKMEAGKLEVTPIPTDPAAIIASVIALLNPQADSKNLYLRSHAEPVGWVHADPVRVRQCLFNIIGNAVKFTDAGGVEVLMRRVGKAADNRLRFEVADTGVGIPEAAKAALFDRFQQAHAGPSHAFGGTGLGLAISRNLARMMGGDMGFASTEGVGSVFWFEIAAPEAEAQEAPQRAPIAEREPLAGLRILVVDDNRTNRLVGLKSLEALGAYAETADSGEAAIAAAVSGGYDLILMDVNMPGMDGLEATRRIRGLPGREASVPIVALTADVMTHQQQFYRAAGMDGFIPKPFSPAQLLTEIARLST